MKKEQVKRQIKEKVFNLCRKNDKLVLLNSRLDEISQLISANKKSESLMIQQISKLKGKLNFGKNAKVRKNASKKGVKKIGSNTTEDDRIRIPFYVYPLKDHNVCYEFDQGRNGNRRLVIRS